MIATILPENVKADFLSHARVHDLTSFNSGIKIPVNASFNRHKLWFMLRGGSNPRKFNCKIRTSFRGTVNFELPFQYNLGGLSMRITPHANIDYNTNTHQDCTEGLFLKPATAVANKAASAMHMFSGHIDMIELISDTGTTFVGVVAVMLAIYSDINL
jgi:hypothetical protein